MQLGDDAYSSTSQFYLGENPFFGPAVSCPEINDATLGKISKTFS